MVYIGQSRVKRSKKKRLKDLEMFTDHIDDLVQVSKIKVGLVPKTFETKKDVPMMMSILYIYIVSWTTAVRYGVHPRKKILSK